MHKRYSILRRLLVGTFLGRGAVRAEGLCGCDLIRVKLLRLVAISKHQSKSCRGDKPARYLVTAKSLYLFPSSTYSKTFNFGLLAAVMGNLVCNNQINLSISMRSSHLTNSSLVVHGPHTACPRSAPPEAFRMSPYRMCEDFLDNCPDAIPAVFFQPDAHQEGPAR